MPSGRRVGRIDESARPFTPDERRLAEKLAAEGKEVQSRLESTTTGERSADAEVDGVPTEFKTIQPSTDPADSSYESITIRTTEGPITYP